MEVVYEGNEGRIYALKPPLIRWKDLDAINRITDWTGIVPKENWTTTPYLAFTTQAAPEVVVVQPVTQANTTSTSTSPATTSTSTSTAKPPLWLAGAAEAETDGNGEEESETGDVDKEVEE
jgi:hypothetical protein